LEITVVGGGLAGSEAAYQIATRGGRVTLVEMRPHVSTPAHTSGYLAELVCSNSLKSQEITNAHGLLKEELRLLDSIIVKAADGAAIPGGKALVVDRNLFAQSVTSVLESHPHITVRREEVSAIPGGRVIVATGPLTSDSLAEEIRKMTGKEDLHFFDAISPIVDGSTIDMSRAFFGSRYTEKSDDYLNCPMTGEEYTAFYEELLKGRRVDLREFEKTPYFEGCLPIEVMAERGRQTLLYGPMKPVGMVDEKGRQPFAIVQLRREDAEGTMYNLVGFQTKLTYPEQDRILRMIPALRKASFFRYGSIHRNTFLNGPATLTGGLQFKMDERILFAGQITGVEGYMESTAMGLVAAISALSSSKGKSFIPPPENTCTGALLSYVTTERKDFQPMNVNFGLFQNYNKRRKKEIVTQALELIKQWRAEIEGLFSE
jgi:methylenetetrahydrofolate--tRNA-(uracil-5-)-methyltransferase